MAATAAQIRGMLLEEVVLALLGRTGFRTVTSATGDDTLTITGAGLAVRGRGELHQIDAIADYRFTMTFGHPIRLLAEAKAYQGKKVGVDVVRQAIGTLKDVSEYFVPERTGGPQSRRFHYRYAIFSANGFSPEAQRLAFAQDIFPVTLADLSQLARALTGIKLINDRAAHQVSSISVKKMREIAREQLRVRASAHPVDGSKQTVFDHVVALLSKEVTVLGGAFLATTTSGFPLFLVPARSTWDEARSGSIHVRIRYSQTGGWWMEDLGGTPLLEFDLPDQLFDLFDSSGRLEATRSLHMKESELSEVVAIREHDQRVELVHLILDRYWISTLRETTQRDHSERSSW